TGQGCDADTLCPEYKVVAADVELVVQGFIRRKKRKVSMEPALSAHV
ncbi:MAG: hypothetical protein JWO94_2681, partial [Verrucomicrobiaceae bacterium]|nr:hypothetical protein [Verrucomicrobiaceae bacterium]